MIRDTLDMWNKMLILEREEPFKKEILTVEKEKIKLKEKHQ